MLLAWRFSFMGQGSQSGTGRCMAFAPDIVFIIAFFIKKKRKMHGKDP